MDNHPQKIHSLTSIQKQFYGDNHRFIVNSAGRRSRKTLLFMRKVLLHAMRNKETRFFHGAPTRQQAKDIFWKRLKKDTRIIQAKSPNETELYVQLINGSEIYVVGLDKPERIEGQEWHGCHITEMGNVKELAWPENIRPALSDTGGFAYLDGVPQGRNHYYDLALYAAGGILPTTKPKLGAFAANPSDKFWSFYSWFSEDVLSQEEIISAKRELDERTYRQEYQGSFESYEGLAYYAFSKNNLKKNIYDSNLFVHIGMDFNVDPMTATFNHIRSDDIFQFGEAYLPRSNTYEMSEHIKLKFPVENCIIYPDSTGKHESSNATESDISILKKAGFQIKARSSNPYQRDRINAVNSKLNAGNGEPHYFIDPDNCPKTINDYNKVETHADGRINKDGQKLGLTHISDAEGYLISYLYPIRERKARGVRR